jgi:CO dehydrogenase maturation factor
MAVGEFADEDLGTKCYHSKIGAAEIFLSQLIDKENEYVIVDMTAGADSFASGLFTKFDIMFFVAEPTLKSISVYEQYKRYAREYKINIKVVANKVEDDMDIDFIRKYVGGDLVAIVKRSPFVRSLERGSKRSVRDLEPANRRALSFLKEAIDRSEKNWKKFYGHMLYFHIKNAEQWANAAVGEDVRSQIDPEFDIQMAVGQ